MNVAVVGLGKLGCPLAAVIASAGHAVVGIDLNKDTVYKINHGIAPVEETGLAELLATPELDLAATTCMDAVEGCDVIFVIVPTPSDETGFFVNEYVLDAVASIGHAIRDSVKHQVVVISSTVMPGSMEGAIKTTLVKTAGRKVGRLLGLCYSPEFIALGSVIADIRSPDMVLIGESDKRAGEKLQTLIRSVVGTQPPVVHMNLVNAELAKIAVNAFVTMKLSFANNLAEICDGLAGADAAEVANAVGWDRRVGGAYLRPATAFGGPCFPRDTRAYAALAQSVGTKADLALATDDINRRQTVRLLGRVLEVLPEGARVSVLGMAYKPQTGITTEAVGVDLVTALLEIGVHVSAYDPVARPEGIEMATDLEDALLGASVIVITTAWPEFAGIVPLPDQVLIDPWGIVQGESDVRVGRE